MSIIILINTLKEHFNSILFFSIFINEMISATSHFKFRRNYDSISLYNNSVMDNDVENGTLFTEINNRLEKLQTKSPHSILRENVGGKYKEGHFLTHKIHPTNESNKVQIFSMNDKFEERSAYVSDTEQLPCWPYYIFKERVHVKEICQVDGDRNGKTVGEVISSKNDQGKEGFFAMRELNPRKFAKFLNLFTIVKFPNELCVDGDESFGTCYQHSQCERLGGTVKGTCANGHGVCCHIQHTCGERTNANGTYFVAGNFLDTSEKGISACSLVIDKADSSVKQIRVDFIHFMIAGPIDGNCQIERFVVTGQNRNNIVPEICGVNSGQHIYLDVDMTEGPIMIATLSSRARGISRDFVMRILQLREGDILMSPGSCLQYHVSDTGTISSFNYQPGVSDITNGYMNGLNYAVCIKKENAYCSITYSNLIEKVEMPFELNNLDEDGMPTVYPGEAGTESYNCPDDYIVLNKMKLCGYRLNDASENPDFRSNHLIKDADNGPFVVSVRTNSNVTGRGFSIRYKQNLCE